MGREEGGDTSCLGLQCRLSKTSPVTGSAKPPSGVAFKAPPLCLCGGVCLQLILFRFENQHYLLTLCYARRTACESSPIRDRPTCLAGPRPWAGQAARRVRNVATLQWEPSAMGHLGINVHARALAMECSNRGQVIWLAMMGTRAQVQPHEPGE